MNKLRYFLVFITILVFATGCACFKTVECVDSDKDGITDDLDQCPNTPLGVRVDNKGCPLDSDGDGVPDYMDKCPNTPKGVRVDNRGCPLDSDGDGVLDYMDKCPNTPRGIKVDSKGCATVRKKLIILYGIKFDLNSDKVSEDSEKILSQAVIVLRENPTVKVSIEGHTCSLGSEEYNMKLSQKRALSVKNYLASQGIANKRMETLGKGEKFPIASNETTEGRNKNRRIEFIVIAE
jgi:OOP family OmpA-OmpF porin